MNHNLVAKPHESDSRRCSATSKRSAERCKKWAEKGTSTCKFHGSKAPQVQRKAKQRLALETLGEWLAKEHLDPEDVDPLEVLLDSLGRSYTAAKFLGSMVRSLEDITGPNHLGDAVPHVYVEMWETERDRAARLAAKAIELGVREMQVRLSERQGQMIAQIFAAALDDASLGLTPEQRNTGRKLVARHLRTLPP